MTKFALLTIAFNFYESVVFFESTDPQFIDQAVEELKDSHFVFCDRPHVGPHVVRLMANIRRGEEFKPFDIFKYCCDRGWEPFQVLKGELHFRKELEEEAAD